MYFLLDSDTEEVDYDETGLSKKFIKKFIKYIKNLINFNLTKIFNFKFNSHITLYTYF